MAAFTVLGVGTLTLGTSPQDFSGEVLGAKVTHEYEEVGEARTMLNGDVRPAGQRRNDGLTASVENDLTAAGFYKYLVDNDNKTVAISFTPNTADAAAWAGEVVCSLPGEIGADEFGAPIVSDIELKAVGLLTFTPGTVPAP